MSEHDDRSLLAALLVLVNSAGQRLSTLELEVQDRSSVEPDSRILAREVHDAGTGKRHFSIATRPGAVLRAREATVTRKIWVFKPARLRVDVLSHETLIRRAILREDRWWRWTVEGGSDHGRIRQADRYAGLPPLLAPPLLMPARVLSRFQLSNPQQSFYLGRRTILAEGRPRLHLTASDPVEELTFDLDHGVILRWATCVAGRVARESVAVAATFGGRLSPELFDHRRVGDEQPSQDESELSRDDQRK